VRLPFEDRSKNVGSHAPSRELFRCRYSVVGFLTSSLITLDLYYIATGPVKPFLGQALRVYPGSGRPGDAAEIPRFLTNSLDIEIGAL
jgi:hypothetical protein